MFNVGEYVVYGATGVCLIKEMQERRIGNESVMYYVLVPYFKDNTTIFVPQNNEALLCKMHKVMQRQEIEALIADSHSIPAIWEENDIERRKIHREILSSCDRTKVAGVIKALIDESASRKQNGKKLQMPDEQILKQAQDLLYGEIAYVLNMPIGEVSIFK